MGSYKKLVQKASSYYSLIASHYSQQLLASSYYSQQLYNIVALQLYGCSHMAVVIWLQLYGCSYVAVVIWLQLYGSVLVAGSVTRQRQYRQLPIGLELYINVHDCSYGSEIVMEIQLRPYTELVSKQCNYQRQDRQLPIGPQLCINTIPIVVRQSKRCSQDSIQYQQLLAV